MKKKIKKVQKPLFTTLAPYLKKNSREISLLLVVFDLLHVGIDDSHGCDVDDVLNTSL